MGLSFVLLSRPTADSRIPRQILDVPTNSSQRFCRFDPPSRTRAAERQVTRALLTMRFTPFHAVLQLRFTLVGNPDRLHSGSRVGGAQGLGLPLAASFCE